MAYSDQQGVLLCSQNLNGVLLSNGVFHVKLEFPDCDLTSILNQTTATKNLLIRVVDKTSTSPVNYSFQAIHSIPISMMSNLSKQLVQMGADPGQVLTWTGDYWAPADPAITSNGTLTSLTATDGLYGGTITESGIIGIQDGGVTANKLNQMGAGAGQVLKWNGNAWEAEDDFDSVEVDPSVRAFARNDVTGITPDICNTNQVLRFISVDSSLRCFDIVKDAIVATEDKLAPSQKAVSLALDLKQDEIQVTTNLELKSVTLTNADSSWIGLQAPAGSSNFFYILPGTPGATGQFLKTNGAGNLVWDSPSVGSSNIAAGSINDSHISSISTSKITGLDGQLTTINSNITSINTSLSTIEDTVRNTDLAGLTPVAGTVTDADTVKTSIEKIVGNVLALQGVQNDYLLKTGGTLTGDLSLSNNSITNLVAPIDDQDAANKKYVDDEITAATYWTKTGFDLSYLTGSVDVGNKLRLKSTTASFLEFKAPDAMGVNKTYIFPANDMGANGHALTTDGLGNLAWSPFVTAATSLGGDLSGNIGNAQLVANSVGTNEIADSSVTNAKLSLTDGGIPQAKVQNLTTDLSNKEPVVALHASPAGKYWDGNKTWQVLNTTAVPEGTNEYFTEARVQSTLLSNYVAQPSSSLSAADSLILALGKLQGQISSNDTELSNLSSKGLWEKNGSKLYYNSGFIGLGTNNPSGVFNIVGTGGGDDDLQIDSYGIGEGTVMLRKGQGTALAPQKVLANDRLGIVTFRGHNGTAFTELAKIQGSATADLDVAASGMLQFYTTNAGANSEKMRITPEGFVGIGTTTPNTFFQVGNNTATTASLEFNPGSAQGAFRFTSNPNANWIQSGVDQVNGSAKDLSFSPYSSTIAYMTIQGSTGNVGIGTNAPSSTLSIANRIQFDRGLGNIANGSDIWFSAQGLISSESHLYLNSDSSGTAVGDIIFGVGADTSAATNRMIVKNNGNVGIGTSAPTTKLEVAGTVKATNFQGTLNGFKMAAGSFGFSYGACGNTVGTPCNVNISSGNFTTAPVCTITMKNTDATDYTEKMVIKSITTTALYIWRGKFPDAGTTMQGFWTCMGQ